MQTVLFNQQVISHCDREREGTYRGAGHITKHHGTFSDVVVTSGKLCPWLQLQLVKRTKRNNLPQTLQSRPCRSCGKENGE